MWGDALFQALTEGFEFLGHRVRLRWDDRWGYWPRIEIPKARVKDFHHRIKQSTTRGRSRLSFQEVIDALNPVLLGWGCFYQHCYGAKQVLAEVANFRGRDASCLAPPRPDPCVRLSRTRLPPRVSTAVCCRTRANTCVTLIRH